MRHGTSATGAVILAAAALEAGINEFHLEAADGSVAALGLAGPSIIQIVSLWDTVERAPLLRKYEWALALAGRPAFDRG
ncbi:MAG TPA: hypothetical protein VJU15_06550, partial [Gemmatimonadales bacterium]|nr:hypothetical protein [Gemmatimonadales bacterium]